MTFIPSRDLLTSTFKPQLAHGASVPQTQPANETPSYGRTRLQAREELYHNFSVVDDAKSKAQGLSAAAVQELNKAAKPGQAQSDKLELYSPKFYAASVIGGMMACGLTHAAVTPLDLVKCRRQVNASLYRGNVDGWTKILRADGIRGIFTGWTPTLMGYALQGGIKYGGYEYFKKLFADVAGPKIAEDYKTLLVLGASASAEVLADTALCPFEAVKVRMQTTMPPFAKGAFEGMSKVTASEGVSGLFKGLTPLWGRQIPYTMMKFGTFETVVAMIYQRMEKPKDQYSKTVQTGVSFLGGYIAGIACAVVSHPADVMVSKLNAERQAGESFGAATSRIYSKIGFAGLWNGLPVRIVMVGTLTGLQWMIYDSYKIYMGFPTTGGGGSPQQK